MKKHHPTSHKSVSPAEATEAELCAIPRGAFSVGNLNIGTDSFRVWMHDQESGESPRQQISIPRADFNRLIRWYLKPQRIKGRT